jgi:phosphoenolpyruvate carboxykinase (ATP)
MLIKAEDLTIEGFKQTFKKILELKEKAGIKAVLNNPPDLFERAKLYGVQFKNGSWGWASNIWHRSATGSVVITRDEELKSEHKFLMMRVLEHILAQGPLIQVDCYLGSSKSPARMHARLYCDPQFPDIAYRWSQLNFPAPPDEEPDVMIIAIPHYLGNPNVPGTDQMLRVIRFPLHNYTIITCSSYQGEVKKAALSHWIYHVYKRGGCGEHASLKEFTVKRVDGSLKRIVMCIWGLSGTGKSTHSMYVFGEHNRRIFIEKFGVDPTEYVFDQAIKNDDVVAIFEDRVYGSERGSWTKTEDIDETQFPIWKAANSPRALHENTEFDSNGNPSFEGKLFQYYGLPNKNARSVFYLEDTGYFNGDIDSSGPLNVAVFISPGNLHDYAWCRIEDTAFAAKVLADGRTVGHPAQSISVIGKEIYESRYCLPFTMGVSNTAHIVRFYEILEKLKAKGQPVEVYLINTTGRIGAEYEWVEEELGNRKYLMPRTKLMKGPNGIPKPIGGTSPTIEETELFLLQATRGAVKYKPHPIWGEKVLVPVYVEGISQERLKELDPFTYRSMDEMIALLKATIIKSKYYLDQQAPGLPEKIYNAMDF